MPLYVDLRRIYAELAAAGLGDQAALAPEQLFPFDQLHYHGTDAVRRAADLLGLSADSRVLEVGSGLGGPARYLAQTVGCQVTALDIQPEMQAIASELTTRCGLASRVAHVCGDALVCRAIATREGPRHGEAPPRRPALDAVLCLVRSTATAGCRAGAPRRWPARPRDRPRRAA